MNNRKIPTNQSFFNHNRIHIFTRSFLILAAFLLAACGLKADKTKQGLADLSEIEGDLSDFKAVTLKGKDFTQEDFKDYDLTMINIWSTTCELSLTEMEGLELTYEALPENVNMITICADAGFNMEIAQALLKKKGAEYDTLVGNRDLNNAIIKNLTGTPTTIFVDSSGHIVGKALVGAPCTEDMENSKNNYLEAIEDHLKELNSKTE